MERAVVTGATGMIGAALVRYLLARGVRVTAVVNPGSARLDALPADDALLTVLPLALDGYGEHAAQMAGAAQAPGGADGRGVFYHLAWSGTLGPGRHDAGLQRRNVAYALDAVRLARALGCTRFIGAGSQAEYGLLDAPFSASTPTRPLTEYGRAKLEACAVSRALAHELGCEHIWARIGSVYGPGDNQGTVIMQALRHAAAGEPFSCTPAEQPWDHIYCDDAARALALMGERGADGRIYPLGTGSTAALRDHITAACTALEPGCTPRFGALDYPEGQVMHLQADISELQEDTGFEPQVDFEEGIRRTASWYRQMQAKRSARPPRRPQPGGRPAAHLRKTLSVMIPCYNEQDNVIPISEAVVEVMERDLPDYDYEILFIDNCSKDLTRPRLRQLCAANPKIKAIFNVKNFGQFNSPYYGLTQTSGDAVVCLCADFQDPPELIPRLVAEWEGGAQIVCGIKTSSRESKLMYCLRTMYYKLIHKVSDVEQIRHFTGFGLYDRSFIDVLRDLHDPTPFLRGIVAELGGTRVDVEYEQAARRAGKTHNNWYTLYDAAMLSFTSYTKVPLRIASIGGFALSVLFFLVAAVLLVVKLVNWNAFAGGQTSILMAVLLIGAVLMFFLGLLGEYVMAIGQRAMDRPLVVEQERINFDQAPNPPSGNGGQRASAKARVSDL